MGGRVIILVAESPLILQVSAVVVCFGRWYRGKVVPLPGDIHKGKLGNQVAIIRMTAESQGFTEGGNLESARVIGNVCGQGGSDNIGFIIGCGVEEDAHDFCPFDGR
jgi:hypothetical protein